MQEDKEKQMTQEAAEMYALKICDVKNVARACANCVRWDAKETRCGDSGKLMPAYMVCRAHEFKTERIAKLALEFLEKQQIEADKIENILALALTAANTTTCFIEDLETRVRSLYNAEKDKDIRRLLRKDLDMADSMKKAFADIEEFLVKIERRYRFYIQPHVMRIFTKGGKFNEELSDGHLNNAMEFGRLLMLYTIKCIGNKENDDAVFSMLHSLKNDSGYALTEKDAEHYRLRGYGD